MYILHTHLRQFINLEWRKVKMLKSERIRLWHTSLIEMRCQALIEEKESAKAASSFEERECVRRRIVFTCGDNC